MNSDNGGPAFPATSWDREGEFLGANNGMTLRDYFAAHAPAEREGRAARAFIFGAQRAAA